MSYLHGAYAVSQASGISVAAKSGTLPVYFGVVPIHQLADAAGKVKTPLLLTNYAQARQLVGYSDDWESFDLCEALCVHFASANPVGPIVVVNIFDPATHRSKTAKTASVTMVSGRGELADGKVILSTIAIAGKTMGTDYTASYDDTGANVKITDLTGTMSGAVSVAYSQVDLTGITAEVVAEMIKPAVGQVYEISGKVPTILAAPGWSDDTDVNNALKSAAAEISGHWNAYVLDDVDVAVTKTINAAILKKAGDMRTGPAETPCWPMATDGKHYYHLSTLSIAKSMEVDAENGNIPYETCSNKAIDITGLVVKGSDGAYAPIRFDQSEANRLNAVGIRTAVFWGGKYRLWGPHTGAYNYNGTNAPEEIFDSSVRMTQYLGNSFQLTYGDEVDKPMHRSRIDSILDAEQERLDNLVNRGALLFGAITFVPDSNPTSDLMSGQFVFDTGYTTTPPARAIINRYRYTAQGLELLTGGES